MKHAPIIIALFAFISPSSSQVCAKPEKAAPEWFAPALMKAPTVVAYSRSIKGRISWTTDYVDHDSVELAVGESRSDHFSRGLTVRVHRNGAVYVLEERKGEDYWRLDRAADRKGKLRNSS